MASNEELFDLDPVGPGVWKLRQSPMYMMPEDALMERSLTDAVAGRGMVLGKDGVPMRTNIIFWKPPQLNGEATAFIRASDLARIGVFV